MSPRLRSRCVDRWTRIDVSLHGRRDGEAKCANPTRRRPRCRTGEDDLLGDPGSLHSVYLRRRGHRTEQRTKRTPVSRRAWLAIVPRGDVSTLASVLAGTY